VSYLAATAVCALMATGVPPTPAADVYVSPAGNDSWSGRLAAPNRDRTDGPVATVAAALTAARVLRGTRATGSCLTVLVRKGTYVLSEPLVIGPEDSGADGAPTIIAAYPGEKPLITGGVRLTGWRAEKGRWTLQIPEVRAGTWWFEQLFVGGKRRYRPRLPKGGYHLIEAEAAPSPAAQGRGFDRFQFADGDIRGDWHNRSDVDVLCFQSWTMARMRIAEVDETKRIVRFADPTLSTASFFGLPTGYRYIIENVREALSEPGEWYLDRKSGELTYIPMRGENPRRTEVWAPRLEHLVEFRGDPASRRWVQNVTLRGLTFSHANWVTPPGGYQSAQAEVPIGAAIRAVGARHCTLERCAVRHVGGYAVDFGAACQFDTIQDCEITDTGAGGVKLGETSGAADPELLSGWHTVSNSLIAHGGRMHPAGIGVWVGASPHNTVTHNEICDLYYTGISVGWSWGYAPTASHHNTIEYNHIHHIGQGVLSDMGATYTLGLAPGTVQRLNRFHDIESYGYGGWGIYFDEGTTGMVAENNVVYACKSAGFHQHYGRDNIVRNNVFAMNRESQLMRTRAEDHLSFTFERNIVLWDTGSLLASNWSGSNYRFRNNLYWRTGGRAFDFAGATLEEWQRRGQDAGSVVADPKFRNVAKADFRLRDALPAARVGFVPFDVSDAGRTGPRAGSVEPVDPCRAYPPPPPPEPPAPIVLDFESCSVGDRAPGAMTIEENERATIRVSDEAAAGGSKSLKFTDAPGQRANYNPHLFFTPGYADGALEARFALRVDKGVRMYHEWRDSASPYHVGPSVAVAPDGAMSASGRKLLDVPVGVWFRVEIRCAIGKAGSGKYDVIVRLPGRTAPLRFADIPCDPAFRHLDWFGFTADGTEAGVFFVDDLSLSPRRRK